MDNGPFRMGNPASSGRGAAPRPTANRAPVPEPATPVPTPPPAQHRPATHHPKQKGGKMKFILGGVLGLIVVCVVLFVFLFMRSGNTDDGINSGKYQAVFFTNGQVYFGKLRTFNDKYMKLTDVYYLQTQTNDSDAKNPQKTTADQGGNVQLIKLGDEIHGPDDEMIVAKDHVLFYENLKTDGKVSQSIAKFKKS